MKRIIMLVFLSMGLVTAKADVRVFNVWMSGNGSGGAPNSFTVPTDKVYIIEAVLLSHAGVTTPSNTEIRVSVAADNIAANSFMVVPVSDTYNEAVYTFV